MAKVRAKKTILEKTKYEFTAILPGVLEETASGEEMVFINEPRLAICINFWTDKIKGTQVFILIQIASIFRSQTTGAHACNNFGPTIQTDKHRIGMSSSQFANEGLSQGLCQLCSKRVICKT